MFAVGMLDYLGSPLYFARLPHISPCVLLTVLGEQAIIMSFSALGGAFRAKRFCPIRASFIACGAAQPGGPKTDWRGLRVVQTKPD
jgi:hypothetical protein